jgi:hypothetical protein
LTDSDHGQRPPPPYEAIKAADADEYDNNCGVGGGGGGGGGGVIILGLWDAALQPRLDR